MFKSSKDKEKKGCGCGSKATVNYTSNSKITEKQKELLEKIKKNKRYFL